MRSPNNKKFEDFRILFTAYNNNNLGSILYSPQCIKLLSGHTFYVIAMTRLYIGVLESETLHRLFGCNMPSV